MQPEPTTLAYLAGIIDADGYVTATRSIRKGSTYYGAQIGITGSRREPHDLAAATFGGRVSAHSPGKERSHHLTQYHWQLGGSQVVPIVSALLPYLRVKRGRAQLVLDLQQQLDVRRTAVRQGEDPYPWAPAGYDPTPSLDALVDDIRSSSRGRTWDQYPTTVPVPA